LKDVTSDIVEQVVTLQVKEEQKNLIDNDIRYYLRQSAVEQDLRPLAIYSDDTLVGFCMYGTDEEDGRVWIQGLMIHATHQGRGYSIQAISELIGIIRKERNPHAVFACIHEENIAARKIFQKLGFVLSAEKDNDADVWILTLS